MSSGKEFRNYDYKKKLTYILFFKCVHMSWLKINLQFLLNEVIVTDSALKKFFKKNTSGSGIK
jgi:hypothetical protein